MRIAACTAVLLTATSAWAQPLPVPASYPPVVGEKGVVATHEVSLDMAEKIARGGIEACRKMGFHTTMVVIDSGGTMKAFLRDDKTGPHTVTLAQDKAFTALTLASRCADHLVPVEAVEADCRDIIDNAPDNMKGAAHKRLELCQVISAVPLLRCGQVALTGASVDLSVHTLSQPQAQPAVGSGSWLTLAAHHVY